MNSRDRSLFVRRLGRLGIALFLLAGLSAPLTGKEGRPDPKDPPKKSAAGGKELVPVEVFFLDESKLKMALREEFLELVTPYGKLQIPLTDVRHIDFGFHVDAETAQRVETAILNLGNSEYREREGATAQLLALGAKAYPALLKASRHTDTEIVRRAEEVLDKLREKVPPERLVRPANDVVQTVDSRITGHIVADVFKVRTYQFGDQQVQLGDLSSLHVLGAAETDGVVLPDPGNLTSFHDKIGKTFVFRVTGVNTGSLWGTGVYTSDSLLAAAAVHAGVLKTGQTGLVKVTILAPPPTFTGSTQNGVRSAAYAGYPGAYQIHP
jgi:hypothetical protein